jgi:hypothetical protein
MGKKIKIKYDKCKDKRDGVSGCRNCCKKYFIKYNEYKECVKVCMDNDKIYIDNKKIN